jgi:hypothetical protein
VHPALKVRRKVADNRFLGADSGLMHRTFALLGTG